MVVLLLHHFSDVFVSIARISVDIHDVAAITGFMGMLSSWAYTRLYIFPKVILHCQKIDFQEKSGLGDSIQIVKVVMFSFMWCLVVLHWFWFYKFLEMLYNKIFKGKVEDTVNMVQKESEKTGSKVQ